MARLPRRITAALVCAALIIAAPGASSYEALAAMRVKIAPVGASGAGAGSAGMAGLARTSLVAPLSLPSSPLSAPGRIHAPIAAPSAVAAAPRAAASGNTIAAAAPRAAAAQSDASGPVAHHAAPNGAAAEHIKGAAPSARAAAFTRAAAKSADARTSALDAKVRFDELFDNADFNNRDAAAEPAAAAASRRRFSASRLGKWVAGAGAFGAAAVVAAPSVMADTGHGLPAWHPFTLIADWSSTAQVVGMAVLPLLAYVVPALFKAWRNRRSKAVGRVVTLALAKPTRVAEDGTSKLYILETVKRYKGGHTFIDRFTVRVPRNAPPGSRNFRERGRVILETINRRPTPRGLFVDALKFEYYPNGKQWGAGAYERRQTGQDGVRRLVKHRFFHHHDRVHDKFLSRWAPHESGKLSMLLIGALAALPSLGLAGAAVYPFSPFIALAFGAALGVGVRLLLRGKKVEDNHWLHIGVDLAMLGVILGSIWTFGLPAMVSLAMGSAVGMILGYAFYNGRKFILPKGPAREARRRAGAFLSKVRFAVIGALMVMMIAMSTHTRPAGAGEIKRWADAMEQAGPVGAEYAERLRADTEPIYVVKPWHNEDMSGALGRHYDAEKFVHDGKIMLDANDYGLESGSWGRFELALSTLLHEKDHEKQEDDLHGVPTTTSHEHSAWDHQARFIYEQFTTTPELFAADGTPADQRRYYVLLKLKNYIEKGPAGYLAYVDSYYPKNPKLAEMAGGRSDEYKAYYAAHRAEMDAAWAAIKADAAAAAAVNAALNPLRANGALSRAIPELKPSARTLGGLFFAGLAGLLALFGLERAARVLIRRRRK